MMISMSGSDVDNEANVPSNNEEGVELTSSDKAEEDYNLEDSKYATEHQVPDIPAIEVRHLVYD